MADVGRLLHPQDREKLLAEFPPAYPRVVAPPRRAQGRGPAGLSAAQRHGSSAEGAADDGAGVQALVVEIGGTTRRPDGSTYHATRSLADGLKAVESKDPIRERGWAATPRRHSLRLEPKVFSS